MVLGDGFGFYFTPDGVYEFAMGEDADGLLSRRNLGDLREREGRIQVKGSWLQAAYHRRGRPGSSLILKRGSPSYEWTGLGTDIRGNTLFASDRSTITAADLPTKKEIVYEVPAGATHEEREEESGARVLGFQMHGNRLFVLSAVYSRCFDTEVSRLRLDLFDRESRAPVSGAAARRPIGAEGRSASGTTARSRCATRIGRPWTRPC